MTRPIIKDSTVLVVGGAGFIGSHLVDRLISEGAKEVIVIDNLFLGTKDNLKFAFDNGLVFYVDDAELEGSLEYIFLKHNIDITFNCATKALNYSFLNPANAYMTNINVMKNLLELQRKGYYQTLCHFSSSEVYGTAIYKPMDEKHPLNPTTTYAAGKAAADIMLQSYVKMFDLDSFIVRPFNNYGPRQNHKGVLAGIIPRTVFRILSGYEPVIYGTGQQSRDFIYVYDTVDAVLKLFSIIEQGDIVNIANDGEITIKYLVEKISELMGYSGKIKFMEERKADVFCHCADNKKLKSMIKTSFTNMETGLKQTIDWFNSINQ